MIACNRPAESFVDCSRTDELRSAQQGRLTLALLALILATVVLFAPPPPPPPGQHLRQRLRYLHATRVQQFQTWRQRRTRCTQLCRIAASP